MDSQQIHLYKEGWQAQLRLVLFMLPGVVFILILLLYLKFSAFLKILSIKSAIYSFITRDEIMLEKINKMGHKTTIKHPEEVLGDLFSKSP